MKILKTIGLSAAISILSFSVQADSFDLVIDQTANTYNTDMYQNMGSYNTQAMNAVELKDNKASVIQNATSDMLNLNQETGEGNLQAANTVDADTAEATISQYSEFGNVIMAQTGGTYNTQALNHVKATN